MLKRLGIYIREMFPLKIFLPFAFLNHYILFFSVQLFLGAEKPVLSFYSLIGVATVLGFMLIMRIFDEFKDVTIDKKLFAQRPYPRGAVRKNDLRALLFSVLILVIALNSLRDYTLPFFLISLFYGYLTYKWFFLKNQISNNLILALITHQPISILINIYVASSSMVQVNAVDWNNHIIIAVFVFFLPVLAWELSRKIKAKDTENEYVTYSKILGTRSSSVLTLSVQLCFSIGLIFLGYLLNFSFIHLFLQALVMLLVLIIYLRFIIKPTQKNNILKKTAEAHSALATFVYILFLVLKYSIEWRWF
jgi:hypothetical protein